MITIEQLNGEIAALEAEKPTFAVMDKLADLYVVRDHLVLGTQSSVPTSGVVEVLPILESDTEFATAIKGKESKSVLTVIDELMSVIKVLNPNLYMGVLRKF